MRESAANFAATPITPGSRMVAQRSLKSQEGTDSSGIPKFLSGRTSDLLNSSSSSQSGSDAVLDQVVGGLHRHSTHFAVHVVRRKHDVTRVANATGCGKPLGIYEFTDAVFVESL
jgi:hypothetical protein